MRELWQRSGFVLATLRLEFREVDGEMCARLFLLILVDTDERVGLAVEGILEGDDDHLHAVAGATSADRDTDTQKQARTQRDEQMSETKHDSTKCNADVMLERRDAMHMFVPNVGCDPGHVDVVQRCVDLILQTHDGKQTQTHRNTKQENERAAR